MIANDSLEQLFTEMDTFNAEPLWTVMDAMVTPVPHPKAVPHIWRYAQLRPLLRRAGELVATAQAERRVFMLTNPALRAPHTTDTLYAGLQLILPGEVARAHRHVAFALRFIIEGENAFTAVGGEKVVMQRGDLVLTPTWEYHDHGNEGKGPMVWLDGLDLPLFQHMPVNFAQPYKEEQYPSEPAVGASRLRYPWADMQATLDAIPGPTAIAPYVHRDTGGDISRTLGAQAERIEAGHATPLRRETTSAVYHAHAGNGVSTIGETTIAWSEGDTFVVPAWMPHTHRNESGEPAYLFRFDDGPLMRSLGWHRTANASEAL